MDEGTEPRRWVRFLGALVCVGLCAVAVVAWVRDQSERRLLLEEVDSLTPVPLSAEALHQIEREDDPMRSRIRAVRAVLAQQLDPTWLNELSIEDRREAMRESIGVLQQVRQWADEVRAARPGTWEPALLSGAAAFLEILRDDRNRLAGRADEWEAPLLEAYEYPIGRAEASRYLAFAYVDTWLSMSQEQKTAAMPVLQLAFRDPSTFARLIDPWLRIVHDRDTALQAVPDGSAQWRLMAERLTAQKDWRNLAYARERYRQSVLSERRATFEHASKRWRGGEYRDARVEFAGVLAGLPPGGEWLPLLQMTLDSQPDASSSSSLGQSLRGWLLWTLDLCLLGHCPLEGASMRRLIAMSDALEPPEEAWAWISAGELGRAEQVEERGRRTFTEGWSPYLILKAAALMDREEIDGARDALIRVDDVFTSEAPYLLNRLRLARLEEDDRLIALLGERLAALEEDAGSGGSWRRLESGGWETVLFASVAIETLSIESAAASPSGAVADLWLDEGPAVSAIVGSRLTVDAGLSATSPHRVRVGDATAGFVPGRIQSIPVDG